jgi:hypothetical protein
MAANYHYDLSIADYLFQSLLENNINTGWLHEFPQFVAKI